MFSFLVLGFLAIPYAWAIKAGQYDSKYGTYIGKFKTLHHDVTGDVYALDNITIYIRRFNYDGEAPDAFFFAGNNSPRPSNRGFIVPNEKGNKEVLGPYRNKNLIIKFPVTKKGQRSFYDIKWISVWCRKYAIDFGHVTIPKNLKTPEPEMAGTFHSDNGIIKSSDVIMEDAETIRINDLSYDGSIEDAIFVMGSGDRDAAGHQIPNEVGSDGPLSRYNKKSITLKVPKSKKGTHIQYFGIWSPTRGMITSVTFPHDMRLPPISNDL